jgi:hypothetical protein
MTKGWTARYVPAVPAPPVWTVGVRPRFVAELKAARVIYLAMWCRRAMTMMTRIGGYLIGLGIFSAVDAERRSELLSQYTAAASRWHAHLKRVEHATAARRQP